MKDAAEMGSVWFSVDRPYSSGGSVLGCVWFPELFCRELSPCSLVKLAMKLRSCYNNPVGH